MDKALLDALDILEKEGVILTPTETVVGISCSAKASKQIERIFKIKQRSSLKAFIVLVDSVEMIKNYSKNISKKEIAFLISKEPTTVILNNITNLPKNLIAKDGTLAFRITKHPELKKIITKLAHPLVSTSANISGEKAPLFIKEVNKSILEAVDYSLILQSNYKPSSKPSRIVKVKGSEVEIIRP